MAQAKISKENRGTIKLSGAISIYEVAGIHTKLLRSLEEEATVNLDLGDVSSCDAAGIQLLFATGKTGEEEGKRVTISKTSKAVQEAARLVGIEPDMFHGVHGG